MFEGGAVMGGGGLEISEVVQSRAQVVVGEGDAGSPVSARAGDREPDRRLGQHRSPPRLCKTWKMRGLLRITGASRFCCGCRGKKML